MPASNKQCPTLLSCTKNKHSLTLSWSDSKSSQYHYLWLRDNCSTAFHPETRERVFDQLSVSPDIHAKNVEITDNNLTIHWSEGNHQSSFESSWLRKNAYAGDLTPSKSSRTKSWDSSFLSSVYRTSYKRLVEDDKVLHEWMKQLDKDGLVLVDAMPNEHSALDDVALRIDYQRMTNFGLTFEVRSEPNPINLAYTSLALPLHTDLANQETPPGYQFLHCLINDSKGGESVFADGLKVVEDLREEEPKHFELLATIAVPFRFHDQSHDIRSHHPLINLDHQGNIVELKYNAHLASIFDLPENIMHEYYLAYRNLMSRLRSDKYRVQFRLNAGDMVVFDNRRVLHGRSEFEPTGHRHLRGCYVDRSEFQSRLRVLDSELSSQQE